MVHQYWVVQYMEGKEESTINAPADSVHNGTNLHFLNMGVHHISFPVPSISFSNISFLSKFMLSFLEAEAEAATLTFNVKACLNEGESYS